MSVHFEITNRAKSILIQELGVVDTLRFLNKFRVGSGDYTTKRERLSKDESAKSTVASIKT